MLLHLLFLHALAFFGGGYFLAFALVFLHLASLCSPPLFGHALSCSAWPVLWGGLAALCLVSRRSVWSRGALLRGLSQCRCECELVNPCESLASRVPVVPLPLRSKHRRTTVFPSLTLLLVGRMGWLHLQRRQNAESSAASSASSDRRSAVLPMASLP